MDCVPLKPSRNLQADHAFVSLTATSTTRNFCSVKDLMVLCSPCRYGISGSLYNRDLNAALLLQGFAHIYDSFVLP